ncbi:MAG: sulfatase-like hydrolase/transferase, partial [Calditrichaeota bacterium]|nr:sulfatase-like hydrolase/transferase [Calditrichota bacterium]
YDNDSEGTFYAREAIHIIRKEAQNRFFLWVGFHEPHSPFNFPIEYTGRYDPQNMPLPITSPEDDRWIPKIFRNLSDQDKRGIIASYYTSVEYLDKNVGMILDELERLHLDENTLIIYFGDQGYLLGEHKRFEKHTMWDEAIKAPLIMQGGNQLDAGKEYSALTEFVDIAPTILDLVQVDQMPGEQGKSLVPLLTGETLEHKDYVFAEFLIDNKAMIRTKKWKYIFTTGKRDLGQGYATGFPPSGILHRLYDVQDDPHEMKDVAKLPENRTVLIKMQNLMINHFKKTDPRAENLPAGLSVNETLAWFCEPPDANAKINAR